MKIYTTWEGVYFLRCRSGGGGAGGGFSHEVPAQTSDAQTSDAQTSDAQTSDAQTSDAQTSDAANVGQYKRRTSTNIGQVQTSD